MDPQLPTSKISASQLPRQVIASNSPPACFLSCRLFRTSSAPSSAATQIMAQMHKNQWIQSCYFSFLLFSAISVPVGVDNRPWQEADVGEARRCCHCCPAASAGSHGAHSSRRGGPTSGSGENEESQCLIIGGHIFNHNTFLYYIVTFCTKKLAKINYHICV